MFEIPYGLKMKNLPVKTIFGKTEKNKNPLLSLEFCTRGKYIVLTIIIAIR